MRVMVIVFLVGAIFANKSANANIPPEKLRNLKICLSGLYKNFWAQATRGGGLFIPVSLRGLGEAPNSLVQKGEEAFLYVDDKGAKLLNPVLSKTFGSEREYRFVVRPDDPKMQSTVSIRISNDTNIPTTGGGGGDDIEEIRKGHKEVDLNAVQLSEILDRSFTKLELEEINRELAENLKEAQSATEYRFESIVDKNGKEIGGNSKPLYLTGQELQKKKARYIGWLKDHKTSLLACNKMNTPGLVKRAQILSEKLDGQLELMTQAPDSEVGPGKQTTGIPEK